MSEKQPLPAMFKHFAGQIVETIELERDIGDMKIPYREPTEAGEKLISEIYNVAAQNNVNLRVWHPDMAGTMDYNPGRLNMHIVPNAEGEWVIQDACNFG